MLQNKHLILKIGCDTAENEHSKIWQDFRSYYFRKYIFLSENVFFADMSVRRRQGQGDSGPRLLREVFHIRREEGARTYDCKNRWFITQNDELMDFMNFW